MKYNWQIMNPFEANLNEKILQEGGQIIEQNLADVHSWLIIRNGKLVWEQYFQGYTAQYLHETQSVTKSIQSLLVGIAIDKGFIRNLDTPIIAYFPDYQHLDWSNNKDKITIRHLLTMTAGLEWNELKVPYTQAFSNDASRQIYSSDWLEYALQKPMETAPGTTFSYSSANPILISKILNEATQISNEQFANDYLYKPLGIKDFDYQKMPKNPHILADIDLMPQDMAKIGQLILNQGKWLDNQIVSSEWLQQSFAPSIQFENGEAYGLSWWLNILQPSDLAFPPQEQKNRPEKMINSPAYSEVYAWGIGGQHIFVIPEYQLVVVFTGGNYETTRPLEPYFILQNFVLAAIKNE
jgi:CubicO group peptidase (beta-lactamase class C family)